METHPDVYTHIRIVISIVVGLGIEYPIRIGCFVVLSAIAMVTRNRVFHATFVGAALLYQLSWMLRQYLTP
jgi:hypothetical protein